MQVHQLTWAKEEKQDVFFNYLSCFTCMPGSQCSPFGIGKAWQMFPSAIHCRSKVPGHSLNL